MKTTTMTVSEQDDGQVDANFDAGGEDIDGPEQVRRLAAVIQASIVAGQFLGKQAGISNQEMTVELCRRVPAMRQIVSLATEGAKYADEDD